MNYKLILVLLFFPILFFGQEKSSFTLNEAIDYARENSYAMLNANDDIAAAKKKVWETTTMGLPQINGTVDYQNFLKIPTTLLPDFISPAVYGVLLNEGLITSDQMPSPADMQYFPVKFGTKHNASWSVSLSQLIFNGSYLVGLQSAQVYLKISESIKEKTDISIKQGVINAYAGVLMTHEGIEILKKNKQNVEKLLFETKEIVKSGFAEEQDAEQLALTLTTIENQLNNLQRLEQYNINMLKYIMGIPIEKTIELTDKMDVLAIQNSDLNVLGEKFDYTAHIDYKISENSVQAGKLLTKLEQSKALPSIGTFLNYGLNAYGEKFKFFSKDQKWFGSSVFGVQINVPIFSSLQRSSRVQQAKINLVKAERGQLETIEKLNLGYQLAKTNYENALNTFHTAKEGLKLAENIERKENIKFKEGLSGSFELNNAQIQLYGKQQEYLQSIFDLISKKAALENAMGK